MPVLIVVEAPCHELFDDEEDDSGSDVILHREDVVAVLNIEEGPEGAENSVGDGQTTIKGQLGYLSSGELAIGIAELNDAVVFVVGVGVGRDAVVAGAADWVVDSFRIFEVDRFIVDGILRAVGAVRNEDVRA